MSRWRASLTGDIETTFWENKRKRLSDITHKLKIWTIFIEYRVVGNKRLPLVVYMCTAYVVPIRYKRGACCLIWYSKAVQSLQFVDKTETRHHASFV